MTGMQQVNLYLPEYRPQRDWMTIQRLGFVLSVAVLALAVHAGWGYWQRYSLEQQLAEAQTALNEQTRRTEQLERSLAGRATDQALVRELETREAMLRQAEQTLSILRGTALGNMTGFSEHLKNLSQASFDGIWLTDIVIRNGGEYAYLAGRAEHSAMVPNFVDRLTAGWQRTDGWRFTRMTGTLGAPRAEGAEEVAPVTDSQLYHFVLETR